jgi:glycyl-tRNA synthetase
MEIEYFIKPGTNLEWHAKWKADCRDWLINTLGIREENLKFRDHSAEELSHYSSATTDVEYLFPMGW